MTRWIVEPLLEARQLLFGADVEEELQDGRAVQRQHGFKVVYQVKPLRPYRLRHQLMNSNHQNVFVIGSIEDHGLTSAGRAEVRAPEEVVRGFVFAGLLER